MVKTFWLSFENSIDSNVVDGVYFGHSYIFGYGASSMGTINSRRPGKGQ